MNNAKESLEMMDDLGTKGYEAARELGELNLRTMETLMGRQMDTISMMMEAGMRQFSSIAEAKGYNDVLKSQTIFAKEMSERVLEVSRENVKLATDTRDEYRAFFEKGVETVAEKMSSMKAVA